jgi:uncharacterized protein YgbK (DUF1537 family)
LNSTILVLADDLTGALETGAKFAGNGVAALVTTELSLTPAGMDPTIQVLVIDMESRHLPPAEAALRVNALARAGRERGVRFIYKKTDSTLRGNIASELGALLEGCPGWRLVYGPAYPQMGRTVRQGCLYVNGVPVSETEFARDPLSPVRQSSIPHLLAGLAEAVEVLDGETDADVKAAARNLLESGDHFLAAGPAALAERLAELGPWPRRRPAPWPVIKNCLVINGSLHELSARQVQHAEVQGWPLVEPGAAAGLGWAILKVPVAARTGETVRDILKQVTLDALVVFGGDTAYGVLTALGGPPVYPLGEIVPGVPMSRARDLYLITKAGGFGSVDILAALRDRLSGSQ